MQIRPKPLCRTSIMPTKDIVCFQELHGGKQGFFFADTVKNRVKMWSRGKKKTREPLRNKASRGFCDYSNSIVATGFSLMSHRTRLTPSTVEMIRSRIVQRTEKGISGTVAVTASTVLTARMITAQPM